MSRHVPRHTFRCPPPPLRVMVARPAQVTQVTQVPITLTQHDTAAAPCFTLKIFFVLDTSSSSCDLESRQNARPNTIWWLGGSVVGWLGG